MASTKEMQRRAKERKNPKKVKEVSTFNLCAVRHFKNGLVELTVFEALDMKPVNDKNALLSEICMKPWGHNPPANHINDYFIQTQTYQMHKGLGIKNFIVNFYEDDEDTPGTHSCREIMGVNDKEQFMAYAKNLVTSNNIDDVIYY